MPFFWLTVEYFYQKYIYEQNYRTPFSSPHPKSEKSDVRNCMFLCFVAKNRKIGTFWLFGAPHARRAHRQGAEKTRACAGCVTATNQFRMIALCDGDNLFSVSSLINRFSVKFYNIFSFWMFFERKISFFLEIFTDFQQKGHVTNAAVNFLAISFQAQIFAQFFFFATAKVIFNFFFYRKRDGASWASHSSCLESSERSARSARELKTKSSTSFFAGIRVWLLVFFESWIFIFLQVEFRK